MSPDFQEGGYFAPDNETDFPGLDDVRSRVIELGEAYLEQIEGGQGDE